MKCVSDARGKVSICNAYLADDLAGMRFDRALHARDSSLLRAHTALDVGSHSARSIQTRLLRAPVPFKRVSRGSSESQALLLYLARV